MKNLFALICLFTLTLGGVLQAQEDEQDSFDHVLFETSYSSYELGAGEEFDLRVKFSATAGGRFVIFWGRQEDTVQITKTGEMVEVSHHYEEGDMIQHTLGVRALDAGSHIIGFALEGSMFTDVAPYRCPNFRYLSLRNTSFSQFNADHCPSLKTMECSGNKRLKQLFFRENREIEEIICTYNDSLIYLELPQESNLKTVDCSNNNQLKFFNVTNQPALRTVKCTNNFFLESFGLLNCLMVDSLHFDNNMQLKTFTLNSAGLEALDLSVAPNLERFYCSENAHLTTIECLNNPQLKYLDLVDCPSLDSLNISNLPQLESLHITDTKLKTINLSFVPNLETLDCSHNRLETMSIESDAILTNLICNHNRLTSVNLSSDLILESLICDSNSLQFSALTDLVKHVENSACITPQSVSVLLQVGQTLDLHGEMNLDGESSQWVLWDSVGNREISYTDILKFDAGRFSFKKTGWYGIEMTHYGLLSHRDYAYEAQVFYEVTVVDSVARPTFSEPSGAVKPHTSVSLSTTTPDARIYYTTDGSAPDSTASLYTDPISIDEAVTIKAIAIQDTLASQVATASYTIDLTANESDGYTEQVRIYSRNRSILLPETIGEVEVFTVGGQCVYKGSATAISVRRAGMYVVVAKGGRWKVAVR